MAGVAAANMAQRDELTIEREDSEMAKGQQRSNREKKKPKQEKVKTVAAVSAFTTPKSNGGKK